MTIPLPHTGTVPTVLTLQDMQHREHPEWFSRSELLFRRLAYDAAAQRAGHVITATRHARGQIVDRLGIEPDRIEDDPPRHRSRPILPFPSPGDAERLSPLGLPRRFVLYPANMWPHKNHDRLVEALARTDDREVRLVLTGQDYGRLGALLDHARQAWRKTRVKHLGHVAAAVIPALYRRATGMVFPSLFEGFGIPGDRGDGVWLPSRVIRSLGAT